MEIEFTDITKMYGKKCAVDNVNLTLESGIYGLIGANGSGKSTLIKMLAGLLKPTSGKITLDGKDICAMGAAYRSKLGYLPQDFGFYPDFSAYDFLRYLCAVKGIGGSLAEERCKKVLYIADLYTVKDQKIKTFSGGMRQRLGIAQALLNDPSILIIDEPTSGLDPRERIRFRNKLGEMAAGKIIFYATHIISDISYLADRILIMKDGKIASKHVTSDELLAEAEGTVWLMNVKRSELPGIQSKFNVSGILPLEGDYLRIRIVSDVIPRLDAVSGSPDLEDVYMRFFGEVSEYADADKV
ncbi:MAG: putative ABC transporter ATP-binding protein YxlF [Firmicutes bacterium ADurb.Bin300]|nr:MAG: putative ABC transporter ATP-binding protein YxlF [Firmicutes bacterium ADurb.Bin300]